MSVCLSIYISSYLSLSLAKKSRFRRHQWSKHNKSA